MTTLTALGTLLDTGSWFTEPSTPRLADIIAALDGALPGGTLAAVLTDLLNDRSAQTVALFQSSL